mmetsp:Transcript_8384/g.23555  ORF Transcript_8384/g.23555 Transcript_8384/m.23555 type:complete len:176 (-) Transcript_8384:117-644(-)
MSLLVEPYNRAACDRNEKERLMIAGLLKQKTREDYLLDHIGLNRNFQPIGTPSNPGSPGSSGQRPRRRAPSEGASTPLRAAASTLTLGEKQRPGKASKPQTPSAAGMPRSRSASALQAASAARPPSRGSLASTSMVSTEAEPRPRTPPTDPLIQVMMKGPPLFSPNFATAAASIF